MPVRKIITQKTSPTKNPYVDLQNIYVPKVVDNAKIVEDLSIQDEPTTDPFIETLPECCESELIYLRNFPVDKPQSIPETLMQQVKTEERTLELSDSSKNLSQKAYGGIKPNLSFIAKHNRKSTLPAIKNEMISEGRKTTNSTKLLEM